MDKTEPNENAHNAIFVVDNPFSLALQELELQNKMADNLHGSTTTPTIAKSYEPDKKDQTSLDDLINFRNFKNTQSQLQVSPQVHSSSLKPINTNQMLTSPLRQPTNTIQTPQKSPNKLIFQDKSPALNSSSPISE
jgi:hypothetical protein